VNSTCYISSGSGSDSQDYPDDINTIILFDLPLSGEIIKPFLNRPANPGQLTIYLLYSEADLRVNRTIINHTLPNAENLAAIINELENNNADKVFDDLSLSAGRAIAYQPAPAFWERSAKILSETQIISADKTLSAGRGEILDAWFDALDRSSTYKASVELRDKCELFQKELLTSSPAELAKYLYKYISG